MKLKLERINRCIVKKKVMNLLLPGLLLSLGLAPFEVRGDISNEETTKWAFFGEYHYFQASQEGLAFARRVDLDYSALASGSPVSYEVDELALVHDERLKFKWDSGFKVGVAFEPACSGWRLNGSWDYFRTSAKNSRSAFLAMDNTLIEGPEPRQVPIGTDKGSILIPNFGVSSQTSAFPIFGGFVEGLRIPFKSDSRIDAKWLLHTNQFDLALDKSIDLFDCVTFSPLLGLRGLLINQQFTTLYTNLVAIERFDSIQETVIGIDSHMKTHFRGIGPLMGFEATWELFSGFGIYGEVKGALLWGKSSFSQRNLTSARSPNFPGEGGLVSVVEKKADDHILRGVTDLGAGIYYQRKVGACGDKNVALWVGWEHHTYYSQNFYIDSLVPAVNTRNEPTHYSGDLTLWGLIAGASFSF